MKTQDWTTSFAGSFRRRNGEATLSPRFAQLLSVMLAADFHRKTGITVQAARGKIVLVQSPRFCKTEFKGITGKIEAGIAVLHYGSDAEIHWKGKNGMLIRPSDVEIDEGDISIWFENLAVDSIRRSWARITKKPKLDASRFLFKIEFDTFLWEGLYFQFFLKNGSDREGQVQSAVEKFTAEWNEQSERSNRKQGVIHQVACHQLKPDYVAFYMDFGSSSPKLLEQFLLFLNEVDGIERIRISSFL